MHVRHITHMIIAAAMAAATAPVWAQYKCTSPEGRVSYQERPCASQQRSQALDLRTLPPPSAGEASAAAADLAQRNAALDKRIAIRRAIDEHRPLVGMTAAELQQAMGAPNTVNASQVGATASDQHVYQRGTRTIYVYVQAGRVTAIQDTASGRTAAAPVAGKCLSRREVWELEVEASRNDVQRNDDARTRYQQRIALAKDCS